MVNGTKLSSLFGEPGTRHGSSWSPLLLSLSLVLRVLAAQDRRAMWVQTDDVNPSLLADNTVLCLKDSKDSSRRLKA